MKPYAIILFAVAIVLHGAAIGAGLFLAGKLLAREVGGIGHTMMIDSVYGSR